ncbi:MAG: glycosyltransferase [Bacteroidetes bacterium]|nr:glycosyltransferase [Bacteroidota bacterium]
MYNLVIAIPTFKRPAMLEKLILSIKGNQIDAALIKSVQILVVDNDGERSAEEITNKMGTSHSDFFKVLYHCYPEKGLSNVRNEIFRKALEMKPDYIVCIDDDEYATPHWLNELIATVTVNHADIAMGPVYPELAAKAPVSVSHWFQNPERINNQPLDFFETGNYIISTRFLVEHNLKFNMMFNLTGAEDSYFGVEALKNGAKIYSAANAIAYENISEKRATINWLIKRSYRGAQTFTYILRLEKKYTALLKKMAVNIVYLIAGFFALILLPFQTKYRYWGVLKIAESAGSFASLGGLSYNEYGKDKK